MIYPQYPEDEKESRFTPQSRGFGVNSDYWHSADSDSTEYEVLELVAALVRALQPEIVVETGSAFGFGSQAIGKALQANGHGKLYSLEVDAERVEIARHRVSGLPVEIIHGNSVEWTPPGEIGFAFFDSIPELRAQEFRNLKPWIRAGSIVSFHDAGPQHQVWPSVQGLESEGLLKAIRLHTPRGIALAEVL